MFLNRALTRKYSLSSRKHGADRLLEDEDLAEVVRAREVKGPVQGNSRPRDCDVAP